jgi:hypothetical protein
LTFFVVRLCVFRGCLYVVEGVDGHWQLNKVRHRLLVTGTSVL